MKPIKAFNMKLDHDVWVFLKKMAIDQDKSMAQIINDMLVILMRKKDKKSVDTK